LYLPDNAGCRAICLEDPGLEDTGRTQRTHDRFPLAGLFAAGPATGRLALPWRASLPSADGRNRGDLQSQDALCRSGQRLLTSQFPLTGRQFPFQPGDLSVAIDCPAHWLWLAGREQSRQGPLFQQIIAWHADCQSLGSAGRRLHAGQHLQDHRRAPPGFAPGGGFS
jgi:hypothetical protein